MMRSRLAPSHKQKYVAAGVVMSLVSGAIIGGALALLFPYLGLLVGIACSLVVATIFFAEGCP